MTLATTRGSVRLLLTLIFSLQIILAKANITIEVQPGSGKVAVGEHVVLGAIVVTTAGEVITGYQWYTSANSGGPFTLVGQNGSLVLDNIQLTNAGYYYATVFYQSGGSKSLTSAKIQLLVDEHPKILIQPVGANREPGSNVTFTVTAAGTPPLSYQWRHNGLPLSDDNRITGSTGTSLQIQNILLSDAGLYDVVVSNSFGSTNSQKPSLNVAYILPAILSATNTTGKQGHAFNFSIVASGTPPMTYGADGLPNGLSLTDTNGMISGVPSVYGSFNVTMYATNPAAVSATNLTITLADDIPVIVSATSGTGKQGFAYSYTITATNDPAWFDAGPLPLGMSVDNASGIVSGIPLVSGSYPITLITTNAYGSNSQTLTLNLASGAPLITSALTKSGKQGQSFSYSIKATNNPGTFSAGPLPTGLTVDPISGVISGLPLIYGTFPVTIGVINAFGSDSQTLTITLANGAPSITSPTTATGTEEADFKKYTIKGNNTPTSYWATDLPTGLTVNTNTGDITGTPLYAGNYSIPVFAANAWGVGTTNLQLTISNKTISALSITNVMANYSAPYLLEYTFTLRDGGDPSSRAVVASPSLMSVAAFEDDTLVSQSETGVILEPAASKVLKGYLVLDFTASVASLANGDTNNNGISDAVEAEIASAQAFVNQQPAGSQIGVYEFHRDDLAPQQVIGLTKDKTLLTSAIGGIWTNYVQGFPAASRAWDALGAAIAGLGTTNSDETHYVVFMSDGQDDSSTNTLDNVIAASTNANVQVFTVGFGNELNTTTLQSISSAAPGRFYNAGTSTSALALSFAQIGKDLSSQYVLRWATLKRSATQFLPSFTITYQGQTATNPPPSLGPPSGTNYTYVTNNGVIDTNAVTVYSTNYSAPLFAPTTYAGNVLGGFARLVSDADVNPEDIILRATYVPRYIRQMRIHYRANWPVSLSLNTTNTGGLLDGWSLTQTNDGAGGQWALLSCADTNNLALSIPYATFGNLLTFAFHDPITASNAFSTFDIDNTIYTNTAGTNFYGFKLTNAVNFIKIYTNPPPYGTPIPWLMSYGFTNNFAAAELLSPNGNGLTVWQDYLAGLNPTNVNSTFDFQAAPMQTPPQLTFNTVIGRTYRIDWSTGLNGPWTVLRDGITGTGGDVSFTDFRDLSQTQGMFYRVAVEGP